MKYFSNKFSFLLESMKQDSPIDEARGKDRTASGDKVSKIKRKQKRYEDKFSDASGKFKMNAFINALELLRDQIIAEVSSMMNTARSEAAGYKYYETNLDSMNSLKNRVLDLLVSVYNKSRTEGGNLEAGEDDTIIRTFRDQYVEIATEYETLSKKWAEDKNKDIQERPVDIGNKELESKIQEIKDLFDSARLLLNKSNIKGASDSGNGGAGGAGGTGKIEITDTIVQRKAAYTGKEAETIKAVKTLIYNKYKSTKLAEQPDWKIVYKNPSSPTPTLRENTANVIRGIKAGLSKKYTSLSGDTTGNITKAFVEVLTSLKESISIDSSYKIVTFSDFMRNRVNEADDFDFDAAISVMNKSRKASSSSSSSSKSKSTVAPPKFKPEEYPPTPFKNKEEGNKFREWVIKSQGDWAKNNNLDADGDHNNSYIRKAWKEFGEKYDNKKVDAVTLDDQEMDDLLKEFKKYNSKSTIDEYGKTYVESTVSHGSAGYVRSVIYRTGGTAYGYYKEGEFTPFKKYERGVYNKSNKTINYNPVTPLSTFVKCEVDFPENRRMNQKREIAKVAEWLGTDLKWEEKGKRWWTESSVNVNIDWDVDVNGLYIFFDDNGTFTTGTKGTIGQKISGTWDKGGKSMTYKGNTYTGDNIKSTILKVFKSYGWGLKNTISVNPV